MTDKGRWYMLVLVLVMLLGWLHVADARECAGLAELRSQLTARVQSAYGGSAGQALPDCTASRSVMAQLLGRIKRGGTRLEEEKPFDPVAAQANLQDALSDPGIKRHLAELQRAITDEDTRLFFEAALFDEEGFYGARDLRIQQLQQRLH